MKFFVCSTRRFSRAAFFLLLIFSANAARAVASPPGETPPGSQSPPIFPSPLWEKSAASTREAQTPLDALPQAPATEAPAPTPSATPTPIPTATPQPPIPRAASTRALPQELARRGETLPQVAKRLGLKMPLAHGEVRVYKARRRLEVWNGDRLLKSYAVALGAQPRGHKETRGDGRTPEGRFYICTRNATNSAFHIFLGLSYPALPDAARAAQSKKISPREFAMIRSRLASRGAPLWQTRLGGWVGIHGGSDGAFAKKREKQRGTSDWTAGCIALTNREIEEIYAATKLGTPVVVRP